MNFKEYGNKNKDTIMLLHGGGLSWWNYREEAERLQKSYHIIIPILDGHSDSDRRFTSIEDNAQEIIDYIENNYDGHISLIGGLSLGGQILLEILSKKMTKNALKLKCVFSKCFHGPKREPKKPLNKGLQGDFVLFKLESPHYKCPIIGSF